MKRRQSSKSFRDRINSAAAQRGRTLQRLNICAFLADLNVLATVNHMASESTLIRFMNSSLHPLVVEVPSQDCLSRD